MAIIVGIYLFIVAFMDRCIIKLLGYYQVCNKIITIYYSIYYYIIYSICNNSSSNFYSSSYAWFCVVFGIQKLNKKFTENYKLDELIEIIVIS